jgi:hypothetical protein
MRGFAGAKPEYNDRRAKGLKWAGLASLALSGVGALADAPMATALMSGATRGFSGAKRQMDQGYQKRLGAYYDRLLEQKKYNREQETKEVQERQDDADARREHRRKLEADRIQDERDQKQWRERKRFIDKLDDADSAEEREQAYQDWKRRREYKSENPTYSEKTSRMQENRLAEEDEDEEDEDGPTQDDRDAYRETQYDLQKLHDTAQALREDIERLEKADVTVGSNAASMDEAKRKREARIQNKRAELRKVNTERNRVNERLLDMTRRNPSLGSTGDASRARGGDAASAQQGSPNGGGREQQQEQQGQQQQRAEKPSLEAVNEVLQQRGRETLSEEEYKALGVDDLERAGLLE